MQLQQIPTRPAIAGPNPAPVRACQGRRRRCRSSYYSPLHCCIVVASVSTSAGSHNAPRPPKLAVAASPISIYRDTANQTTKSVDGQLSLFYSRRSICQSYSRHSRSVRKEKKDKKEVRRVQISRLSSIEEAVSAATIHRFQRLHTQRKPPVPRHRLNRPP